MKRQDQPPTSSPVNELVEEFKSHEAQLLAQLRDLDRRRVELRDAAERSAADIIESARGDIRRTVMNARTELLALKAQLDAIGQPAESAFDPTDLLSDLGVLYVPDEESEADDAATSASEPAQEPQPAPPLASHEPLATFPPEPAREFTQPDADDGDTAPPMRRRGIWADIESRQEEDASDGTTPERPWWRRGGGIAVIAVIAAVVALLLVSWLAGGESSAAPAAGVRLGSAPPTDSQGRVTPQTADVAAKAAPVAPGTRRTGAPPARRSFDDDEDAAPGPAITRVPGGGNGTSLEPAAAAATITAVRETIPAQLAGRAAVAPIGTPAPAVRRDEAAAATTEPSATEREILARDRQWFDAFYRGDRAGMAALASDSFALTDSRPAGQAISGGTAGTQRTLHEVHIDVAGVGAVLSGRIVERTTLGGKPVEVVSMLSEIWMKDAEGWKLMGVRIAPPPSAPRP